MISIILWKLVVLLCFLYWFCGHSNIGMGTYDCIANQFTIELIMHYFFYRKYNELAFEMAAQGKLSYYVVY